jgi:hypothetical protein
MITAIIGRNIALEVSNDPIIVLIAGLKDAVEAI